MKRPELLAPAGNLEKLETAFLFGADAVYIGNWIFGLRKFADNFTLKQMEVGIDLANQLGKKVYVVLNGYAHNEDLVALKPYFKDLNRIQPHGFIISDAGVAALSQELTSVPLHVSTQASVTNAYECMLWKELGATRVVLAREVTIEQIKEIKRQVDIEIEVFVHGSMCASYSGKCVISNYTAARDSNRGGCIQSCRHAYELTDEETGDVETTHIMNAKDLMTLDLIPALVNAGVESFKIEGRMKSPMYVASVVTAYRDAIDGVMKASAGITPGTDLNEISNRGYFSGGLAERPDGQSINYVTNGHTSGLKYLGSVKSVDLNVGSFVLARAIISVGEEIEIQTPSGISSFVVNEIRNMAGDSIERCIPSQLISLPELLNVPNHSILRKPIAEQVLKNA